MTLDDVDDALLHDLDAQKRESGVRNVRRVCLSRLRETTLDGRNPSVSFEDCNNRDISLARKETG